MKWNIHSVEDWIFRAFLIGAVLASIVLDLLNLNVKWYIPAIFVAMYLIYQTLVGTQPQDSDSKASRSTGAIASSTLRLSA